MSQLNFDGKEVPVLRRPKSNPPLTPAQREILRFAGKNRGIRSVQAGEIVHSMDRRRDAQIHRRRYASADGLEAMKRLMKRGLVYRDPEVRGLWHVA